MILDLNFLQIKKFTKKDITKEYIKFLNNKENLKFSDQRHENYNYKKCLSYLNKFRNSSNLFLKIIANKKLIGTLTCYVDIHNKNVQIGFLIGNKKTQNKGYATLVLKRLIVYFFKKKYKKISCGMVEINKPMISVCKKNKMFLDAKLTKEKLIEKKFYDVLIYSTINKR
jgi:RimJ/RimL family protein N-acetyltransferase